MRNINASLSVPPTAEVLKEVILPDAALRRAATNALPRPRGQSAVSAVTRDEKSANQARD
jgi:hypothetical protein